MGVYGTRRTFNGAVSSTNPWMNGHMVGQQGDDPRVREHDGLVEELGAVLPLRSRHAPVDVNHGRKRACSGRNHQICGDSAAVRPDCGPMTHGTGEGDVINRHGAALLDSCLFDVQRHVLVVIPVAKKLVVGLLGEGGRREQKDDTGKGLHTHILF